MSNEINLHFAKAAKGLAEVAEGLSGVLEVLSRSSNPDRPAALPKSVDAPLITAENKEAPKRGRPAKTETAPAEKVEAPKPSTVKVVDVSGDDFSSAPPVTADKLVELCRKFAKEEANGEKTVKAAILKHSGVERLALITEDSVRGKIYADLQAQLKKLHESRKTEAAPADEFDL
jgi:hypothetical protein